MTPIVKAQLTISKILGEFICSLFYSSTTCDVHWYLYTTGFTHPNNGWIGLCIKLWT